MKTPASALVALLLAASMPQTVFAAEGDKKEHAEHSKDPMTAQIAPLSGAKFEVGFLANMIHHHQSGVDMAKLAVERAQSDRLKEMARKMIADQQKEIDQMTGWLKEWHQQSPQDHKMPEESMAMMKKDMAELEGKKGEEFDKDFAKKMAHHHVGAIAMSKLVPEKTERKELRELAGKIAEMQAKERKELLEMAGK